MSRINAVKDKLRARRKFYDLVAKNERSAYFAGKAKLALPPGQFRVSFLLTPVELGLVGILESAIHIPVIETGPPTKARLAEIRTDLVEKYRNNILQSQPNLDQFSTTATTETTEEVTNEVNA